MRAVPLRDMFDRERKSKGVFLLDTFMWGYCPIPELKPKAIWLRNTPADKRCERWDELVHREFITASATNEIKWVWEIEFYETFRFVQCWKELACCLSSNFGDISNTYSELYRWEHFDGKRWDGKRCRQVWWLGETHRLVSEKLTVCIRRILVV